MIFGVALIEEYFKYLVLTKYAYKQDSFNEPMDGIVYGVIASLGFALVENIIYVFLYADPGQEMIVGILRMFTAIPAHALMGVIMGYYIGKAKFAETPEEEKALTYRGLFIAIGIHGLYNFILFISADSSTGGSFGFLIFPLLYFSFKIIKSHIRDAVNEDISMNR